ncbi:hypothetical protein AUJ83_03230 [Candidatus Woesearchaeota archaeon CG1_02_33_12]|nr:MAG: hypothetical protein AUJ83_03230 [Candidatus Woesearchaeota archaeon CG1_02_33_12]
MRGGSRGDVLWHRVGGSVPHANLVDVGRMRGVLSPLVDVGRGSGNAPPPVIREGSLRTPHTD